MKQLFRNKIKIIGKSVNVRYLRALHNASVLKRIKDSG